MHPKGITLTVAQRRQLKTARAKRTQTEIAEAIGVSSQHLCQMESGKRSPSFETLKVWSKTVGLTLRLTLAKES
jgi:transcriptional regulator with XRE-family HTH domain